MYPRTWGIRVLGELERDEFAFANFRPRYEEHGKLGDYFTTISRDT